MCKLWIRTEESIEHVESGEKIMAKFEGLQNSPYFCDSPKNACGIQTKGLE